MKRVANIIVAGLVAGSLSACVSESRFIQKANEADNLTKELNSLKQRHTLLSADHADLKAKFEKMKEEAVLLNKEKLTLTKDKEGLEKVLKADPDTLSQNIGDLRLTVTTLEVENTKLKDNIAALQMIKQEKVKDVSSTYEQLLQNMKSEIAKGLVTVSELKGKLAVSMEDVILFDSGKAAVRDDGLEILLKMVETLKSVKDKAIRIEGYTENLPASDGLTRQFTTNWELSAVRAFNVTTYLRQQGVDPTILSAAAIAEYRPLADNGPKEGRAGQRRFKITLVPKD
jgi:chemotaxis protein MotB